MVSCINVQWALDTTFTMPFSSKLLVSMRAKPPYIAYVLIFTFAALSGTSVLAEANPNIAPVEIVRRAVRNEVTSNQASGAHFSFKDEKRTPQLSQTKLMVETSEATAGLLVRENGPAAEPAADGMPKTRGWLTISRALKTYARKKSKRRRYRSY